MYRSQIADFVEYTNGRGVNSVVDYYYASTSDIIGNAGLPEKGVEGWKTNITDTGFNATNKYLWNYEKITFSSGEPTTTNFAVISIYGKEIKEIAEFYQLNNSEDIPTSLPTMEAAGDWIRITTGISIPVPTQDNRYLWNYEITQYTDNSEYKSGPACVAVHGERGNDGVGTPGASLEVQYQYAKTSNEIEESNWQNNMPQVQADSILWMRQKMSNETNWGEPIQISAKDGNTPTVDIVDVEQSDGTIKKLWRINGELTEVSAEGQEGHTPVITIENGVWVIDGEATEQQAQGAAGKDGASIEFVYYRSQESVEDWSDKAPNNSEDNGWTNSPQGIDSTNKYEYMSVRTKAEGSESWSSFSNPPVIWSKWGDKGQDGDGVEYKYCLTDLTVTEKPVYPAPEGAIYNWTDDPTGVSGEEGEKYEYVAIIKTTHNSDDTKTVAYSVTLWNQYVRDGLSSYSMELNNDSDVIAISASSGQPLGGLPTITAKTFLGTKEISDGEVRITATGCTLDDGSSDGVNSLTGRQATLKSISQPSGKVVFSWRPNGADADPLLEKTFTFNKITSPVDYDLIIPQTNFNSKDSVEVEVSILRKREGEPADVIGPSADDNIEVQYQQKGSASWETLSSSKLTITNKDKPYTFRIIKSDDASFVWDSETIEFVSDGNSAKDFNVTASSYVFTKNRAGTITNSPITLTAHAINLGENLTYVWSKYDSEQDGFSPISGYSSDTLNATEPGRYKVAIKDTSWEDEIVLGETQDGATGPAAISITLSNPTMTFHKQTNNETEECKIIVYEGGEPLSVGQQESGPYYTISIHNDSSSVQGVDIEGDTVEISDKNASGSCKITVSVHPSEGEDSSKDFIINWKTIDDGNDAQDFNITASSYALVKGTNGQYKNSITLTAHKINITEGTLKWQKPDESTFGHAGEDTIEANIPGIYQAKIETDTANDDEWEDQIVITEVVDGANGKDAIAVVLSNPSMTFNKTTGGTEYCEVIVYEGANKLTTSGTGAKFSVAKKTGSQNSEASVDGASIKVESPSSNGNAEFTVSITTSQSENVEEDVTVYWTIVDNGSKGDTVTTTATEQVIYYLTNSSTFSTKPENIDYPNLPNNAIDTGTSGGRAWTKLRSGVTSRLGYEYMSKRQITTTQTGTENSVNTYGEWSNPVLCDCYYQDVAVLNTFNTLTEAGTKLGVFTNSDGTCYINATRIQSGSLTIKDTNENGNILFEAGFPQGNDEGRVKIANFTVEYGKIYSNNKSTFQNDNQGVYIGEDGIKLGGTFSINNSGHLEATEGKIGDFTLDTALHTNGKALENDETGIYIGVEGIGFGKNYIKKDGSAAIGGFILTRAGEASFTGKIEAKSGDIGKIQITENYLKSSHLSIFGENATETRPSLITSGGYSKVNLQTGDVSNIKEETILISSYEDGYVSEVFSAHKEEFEGSGKNIYKVTFKLGVNLPTSNCFFKEKTLKGFINNSADGDGTTLIDNISFNNRYFYLNGSGELCIDFGYETEDAQIVIGEDLNKLYGENTVYLILDSGYSAEISYYMYPFAILDDGSFYCTAARIGNYYTSAEIDKKFIDFAGGNISLSNYYTKAQTEKLFYKKSETYSKEESNGIYLKIENYQIGMQPNDWNTIFPKT